MTRQPWYIRGPLWRVRFWRWPHHKYSVGNHRWRDQGVQRLDVWGDRRVFRCDRCETEVLVLPLDMDRPLLNRGDRVVS